MQVPLSYRGMCSLRIDLYEGSMSSPPRLLGPALALVGIDGAVQKGVNIDLTVPFSVAYDALYLKLICVSVKRISVAQSSS